jgi:hypothetical protein
MLRRRLVSGICLSAFFVFASAAVWAQRGPNIFVPPVPNAPFRGVVEVQRSLVQKNGAVINLKTMRIVARDSAGRVYAETRQLVPASSHMTPLLLRVLIYDPQTRVSTVLFPRHKIYRSRVVNRPPSTDPPGQLDATMAGANLPPSQFTKREDLGTHEMDGLQVHGVRETQTLPASGGGQPVVVTDVYWYSDYLHLNVAVKHSDPRTGSVAMALTQVSQDEPEPSLFAIPDGYKPLSMMAAKRMAAKRPKK